MPTHKAVDKDGKEGYQYGTHGKVYTGENAKEKADTQGRAIQHSKHHNDGQKKEKK